MDEEIRYEEDVERSEDFFDKDLEGCWFVNDHRSWPEGLPHFLSIVVGPSLLISSHTSSYLLRQSLELCSLDSAIPDEILEISIGKEGQRFVLFAIEKPIFFFFNNHSLIVIVDDVNMRGVLTASGIIDHPSL